MKNLYIDIDGVLLDRGKAAYGLVDFLRYATENFNCYWLTTHCDGDITPVFLYLVSKVPKEALQYIEQIQPTKWGSLSKTDGIDFTKPFYWLDDNLFELERQLLEEKELTKSFVHFDLESHPNMLTDIQKILVA